MEPPRLPLHPISSTANLPMLPNGTSITTLLMDGKRDVAACRPPKRLLPPEILGDFKKAVQGSDLTKVGLIEILKKQFPRHNKEVIKDTLDFVAERIGSKVSERRWSLRAGV